MNSNQRHRILQYFLFAILSLTSLSSTIPTNTITTISTINTTEKEIQNNVTQTQIRGTGDKVLLINNINNSSVNQPNDGNDINDLINNNSPVDQLTELSIDQIKTPSVEPIIGNNDTRPDLSQGTIVSTNDNSSLQNTYNESNSRNNDANEDIQQNNMTSNKTLISIPLFINNSENLTRQMSEALITNEVEVHKENIGFESHRNKRSFASNSLHSNLDELLNMKRLPVPERGLIRYKRNTNYEELLASLLAAEEAKYEDNYNPYFSSATNGLNAIALNYILNHMNSDIDSDNKYTDLDKLSQYYYENLLPLIESADTSESESASNEDTISQDVPIIVQGYSQPAIPVIPYSVPNRYQRIRRSYYNRYGNPISLYTGLKRKRNYNNYRTGEWGRIVGANNERSAYEDEAQEANKIYSLASLLATGNTPYEYRQRYKRSVHSAKPVNNIKNM